MAKYDKETKFYWLQLKEDFFEDDAIEWLEEQKPNGRDYAYFYLKLCLKSLKSNGILIREVGNILIPYDNKKLAEMTRMDFDTVCVAMELLKKIGLIEILENGEIYIKQLENLIGSVSKSALKKQQQRALKKQKEELGWTESGQVSTKVKDKVKVKDKDKVIYNTPTLEDKKHKYGEYKNVLLKDTELEKLKNDFNNYEELIKFLDEYIEMKGYKAKSHYLAIRKWVVDAVKERNRKKSIEPEWIDKKVEEVGLTDEQQQIIDRIREAHRKQETNEN